MANGKRQMGEGNTTSAVLNRGANRGLLLRLTAKRQAVLWAIRKTAVVKCDLHPRPVTKSNLVLPFAFFHLPFAIFAPRARHYW
jgi:hypothetical protein